MGIALRRLVPVFVGSLFGSPNLRPSLLATGLATFLLPDSQRRRASSHVHDPDLALVRRRERQPGVPCALAEDWLKDSCTLPVFHLFN